MPDASTACSAVLGGQISILDWLASQGITPTKHCANLAQMDKNVSALQLLKDRGIEPNLPFLFNQGVAINQQTGKRINISEKLC